MVEELLHANRKKLFWERASINSNTYNSILKSRIPINTMLTNVQFNFTYKSCTTNYIEEHDDTKTKHVFRREKILES